MSSTLAGQFISTMCSATHLKPTHLCAHLFLHDACEYLPYVPIKEIFKRLAGSPVANGRTKRIILWWMQNKRCYLWNQKTCFDDTKNKERGVGKTTIYHLKQQKKQLLEFEADSNGYKLINIWKNTKQRLQMWTKCHQNRSGSPKNKVSISSLCCH